MKTAATDQQGRSSGEGERVGSEKEAARRPKLNSFMRGVLFALFFISGFCGLAYQLIWTRMAFASFGIITPVLSVVISTFMLGLAVGSWAGGRWIGFLTAKTRSSGIVFYAGVELMIGLSAFVVPRLFAVGQKILLTAGQTDSVRYLLFSALFLAVSIFPWCVFMGATFPFMMAYVRERESRDQASFSFLYLANVLGAMSGIMVTAIVLVEILGFKHTLWVAAVANFSLAFISAWLAWNQRGYAATTSPGSTIPKRAAKKSATAGGRGRFIKWILFTTGFIALAMEVVWTRAFTPVLKTQVYSFAMIVFAYLGATFLGSSLYRRNLRNKSVRSMPMLMSILAVTAFLPIVCNDTRFLWDTDDLAGYLSAAVLLISICPLCAALGYLTPSLIDEYALGDPADAGKVYALNILGCILGPLFASYLLLPWFGERYGLIILGLPFLAFFLFAGKGLSSRFRFATGLTAFALLIWSLFCSVDFAGFISGKFSHTESRRDYAATVVSTGEGFNKHLFVNGVGMTALSPITKFMVHLPLVLHTGKPESALIICFGMGTSYRSALSWNIETTAVELVPSVKDTFDFYHADAARVLSNPNGRVVIDDGRRYLQRAREKFDVIVVDPPPPVEATGSSLLYSREFYELAKQHLKQNGILQAWFPGGEPLIEQAALRSLHDSFPYVLCFHAMMGAGTHMLASLGPINISTAEELTTRMPATASRDLLEWTSSLNLPEYFAEVLSKQIPTEQVLNRDRSVQITDDRPYNEYFLLRRLGLF